VRRSPRKGEKKAIYVLNLVIPTRLIDNCLEPAKSAVQIEVCKLLSTTGPRKIWIWKIQHKNVVTTFLSSVIDLFLIRHGFASGKRGVEEEGCDPPPKKRKVSIVPNYATQNNVPHSRKVEPKEERAIFIHPVSSWEPTVKLWYSADRNQKGNISEEIPQTTVWEDPAAGEMFIVNTRTGNSYSQNSRHEIDGTKSANVNRISRIPRLLMKSLDGACSGPAHDKMPDWLQEALIVGSECLRYTLIWQFGI